jgi:hypothetical protein
MATINPDELLEKEGISKSLLSERGKKALQVFEQTRELAKKHPNSTEMQSQLEKMRGMANKEISTEIERIKKETVNEQEQAHQHEIKKAHSKKVREHSEKVIDDLSICRERLREDRRKKIESGEITPPKKKTLTTKLKDDMSKIAALIPEKLKDNPDVIKRTEKAVMNFLNELKKIWGLNKIKAIETEIKVKFNKLLHEA